MLKELKQIRELLAAKPAPPPPPPKGMWNEFKDFLEQYKVMGLAVANDRSRIAWTFRVIESHI